MTPKEKLSEIRFVIHTHIGDKASLEQRILDILNTKPLKKNQQEKGAQHD